MIDIVDGLMGGEISARILQLRSDGATHAEITRLINDEFKLGVHRVAVTRWLHR